MSHAARSNIINRRNKRKRIKQFELPLTAMLDILVVILVFLLKSYQSSTVNFPMIGGMELPESRSKELPAETPHIVVTPKGVYFNENLVMEFVQSSSLEESAPEYIYPSEFLDEGGSRIIPLYDALVKDKERSELLRAKSQARDEQGQPLPFDGVISFQADKTVTYQTLQVVFYTAAAADYRQFRLVAKKKEE